MRYLFYARDRGVILPGVARPRIPRPTDAELQILNVFWTRGGCTVRQIFLEIGKLRGSGYNSTLKLIQIMHAKGYLRRDDSKRPQVYYAVLTKGGTHKLLLKDLMNRVFGGTSGDMIAILLALKKVTPQQLAAIRQQLDKVGKSR